MISSDSDERIVQFDLYCKTCKHKDKKETDAPCDECLEEPVNTYTDRPVRWEEK